MGRTKQFGAEGGRGDLGQGAGGGGAEGKVGGKLQVWSSQRNQQPTVRSTTLPRQQQQLVTAVQVRLGYREGLCSGQSCSTLNVLTANQSRVECQEDSYTPKS